MQYIYKLYINIVYIYINMNYDLIICVIPESSTTIEYVYIYLNTRINGRVWPVIVHYT